MDMRAVGRREEVGQIVAVLDRVGAGAEGHIVELTGEPGIGKSTVVASTIAAAQAAGWRVWTAVPTAAESDLPWTGLAQLVGAIADEDLDALAPGRSHHLTSATSTERSEAVAPELVAFTLAELFDTAGSDPSAPLLLVVDDLHWLDPQSAGALAYALRATSKRRSAVLLARRTGEASPIEPSRLVRPETHTHLHLSGLSLASLRELLVEATGASLGRAELARIHQRTGGNPLYAIELVRAAPAGSSFDTVNLPASLRDSVGARIRSFPPDTRRVLAAAASTARPTLDLLSTAFADLDVLDVLAPAEADGVVSLVDGPATEPTLVVQFTHPLLASGALDALTSAERRSIHAVLAATVTDRIERATHLMASGQAKDPQAVNDLSAAAAAAARGGTLDTAVELARAAHDAGDPDAPLIDRYERAATWMDACQLAGRFAEGRRALEVLAVIVDEAQKTPDITHAELDEMRQRLAFCAVPLIAHTEGFTAAWVAAERALEVLVDPQRLLTTHLRMTRLAVHLDPRSGLALAEQLLAPGSGYSGDSLDGALLLAVARAFTGEAFDAEAGIALAADLDDERSGQIASMLVEPLLWTDDPRLEIVAERAIAYGLARSPRARYLESVTWLALHHFVRGRWDLVDAHLRLLGEYGEEFVDRDFSVCLGALVLAARGEEDTPLAMLARLDDLRTEAEPPLSHAWCAKEAAIVAHTLGHADAADRLLAVEATYAELGIRAVRYARFRRDLVEALVAGGRVDEAGAAAERLGADADRNDVASARADADAAAGVVAAARGDHDEAQRRFDAAIAVQREFQLDYELARTLLAAGSAARRAGRRRDARDLLTEACTLFEGMGAKTWIRRCADEIDRLGGQRDRPTGLTTTELRVAELVASGMSNVEVANTLFVSVRTVESNLTRIYRKLGIRSRAALGRAIEQLQPG